MSFAFGQNETSEVFSLCAIFWISVQPNLRTIVQYLRFAGPLPFTVCLIDAISEGNVNETPLAIHPNGGVHPQVQKEALTYHTMTLVYCRILHRSQRDEASLPTAGYHQP